MQRPGWLDHPVCRTSASLLLAFFLLFAGARFYLKAFHGFAWDFSINWTAALGLREGLSLYDRPALQQLAVAQIDSGMSRLFAGRFTSFIGLPTTAIVHLPFTVLPFEAGVLCYRLLALVAMVVAIALAGLAVPLPQRRQAWLAGAVCLLSWHAFPFSLQLGQVDAWLMLALAAAVLAAAREHWLACGVAIGVAVLLKVSPGWLLLYCLLQRRWLALAGAALVIGAGLLVSLASQHGRDLWQFFTAVLPSLGDSPLHAQNQSLGAFLARLSTEDVQLLSFAAGIGHWKSVAALLAAGLLWLSHRRAGSTAEGLAVAILCALLAGPLTWDHYLSWAVIPVMVLAARLHWPGLLALALLLLPLAFPVPYLQADVIAANGAWRLATGLQPLALLVLVGWCNMARQPTQAR
jgi:hypothetical protein